MHSLYRRLFSIGLLLHGVLAIIMLTVYLWQDTALKLQWALLYFLLVIAASLGLAWLSSWYIHHLMQRLASLVARIHETGQTLSLPIVPVEVAPLTRELNHCFQQLHATEVTQRQQQARLNQAIASTASGVWEWDISADVTQISSSMKQLLGYADHELESSMQAWQQHIDYEDRHRVVAALNEYIKQQVPHFNLTYRMLHRNGQVRWLHMTGQALSGITDKPQTFVGLCQDVTEAQRLEHSLRCLSNTLPLDLNDYCQTLLHALVKLFDAHCGVIALFTSPNHEQLQPLAVWQQEQWLTAEAFSLTQTPYLQTLNQGLLIVEQHLLGLYPRQPLFSHALLQSYVGTLLISPQQDRILGIVAVLDNKTLQLSSEQRHLISRYARRLAFELERNEAFLAAHVPNLSIASNKTNTTPVTTSPTHVTDEAAALSITEDTHAFTILVVDDSGINRDMLVSMLKRLDCKCEVANNGQAALTKLKQQHYDLVLMDCEMPVMDGYTTTRQWRQYEQAHQLSPIPVLAITAHALIEHRQACFDAGMNDYLTKPLRIHLLREALVRWKASLPATSLPPDNIVIDTHALQQATAQAPVLDQTVLHTLQVVMEIDVLPLLQQFANTMTQQLQQLHYLLNMAQAEDIRQQAHRLKGESFQIGAMRMGYLWQWIEIEAKQNHLAAMSAVLPQLTTALTELQTAIQQVGFHE